MSQENDPTQNEDHPANGAVELSDGRTVPKSAVDALHAFDAKWPGATLPQARVGIVAAILEALHVDGFEITKRAPTDLGVTKGLPGIADGLVDLTGSVMGDVLSERIKTSALDSMAPGATKAAQTGMEIANRTVAYGSLGPDVALKMALGLIGRRTDVVAVKLPEPDANIANPTWIIDEPGFGTQVRVNRDSIDGCVRWGPVRFEDTDEVRKFAAALLAAANVADAAEDGGK